MATTSNLVGIVRVKHDALIFPGEVFEKGAYDCDREHENNTIPACIKESDLDSILYESGLTQHDIQSSLIDQTVRPSISAGRFKFYCFWGLQRVEAAKQIFGEEDQWWTVRLYTWNDEEIDETPLSDGEIYWKVRYYTVRQQQQMGNKCMLLLSKSKQRNLKFLLNKEEYVKCLDTIVQFPGLRYGLELGNIRRHLVLGCDREQNHYLTHIADIWTTITMHDTDIANAVDIATVENLHTRAPMASKRDREYITSEMQSGKLFSAVNSLEKRNQNLQLQAGPLFFSLKRDWTAPIACAVETKEGLFQNIELPDVIDPIYLAYIQLFLAAFRQFPRLCNMPPRRDIRNQPLYASVDPNFKSLFIQRAKLLGFCNSLCSNGSTPTVPESLDEEINAVFLSEEQETRWGRPFGKAQKQLQQNLFLLHIVQPTVVTEEASAMFVLQDFFRAFFDIAHLSLWQMTAQAAFPHIEVPQNDAPTLYSTIDELRVYRDQPLLPVSTIVSEPGSPGQSTEMNSICLSAKTPKLSDLFWHTSIQNEIPRYSISASDPMDVFLMNDTGSVATSSCKSQGQAADHQDQAMEDSIATTRDDYKYDAWESEASTIEPEVGSHEDEELQLTHPGNGGSLGQRHESRRWQRSVIMHAATSTQKDKHIEVSSHRQQRPQSIRWQRSVFIPSPRKPTINLKRRNRLKSIFRSAISRKKSNIQSVSVSVSNVDEENTTDIPGSSNITKRVGSGRWNRSIIAPNSNPRNNLMTWLNQTELPSIPEDSDGLKGDNAAITDFDHNISEVNHSQNFQFIEHNGMTSSLESTTDLTSYLKKRRGWVGMIAEEGGVPRSIRLDHIALEFSKEENKRKTLILARQPHAERIRTSHMAKGRQIVGGFDDHRNAKRMRYILNTK